MVSVFYLPRLLDVVIGSNLQDNVHDLMGCYGDGDSLNVEEAVDWDGKVRGEAAS